MEPWEDDSKFRIEGQAPFYEFYDRDTAGELKLTLYYDEEQRSGRGICSNLFDKYDFKIGFVIADYREEEWRKPILSTWDGAPGERYTDFPMKNRREEFKKDVSGRLIRYSCTGDTDERDSEGNIRQVFVTIDYAYDTDGRLLWKKGCFDARAMAPYGNKTSYFDGFGREIFSSEYITHGSVLKFYIYRSCFFKPAYCFVYDPHGAVADMIRYR